MKTGMHSKFMRHLSMVQQENFIIKKDKLLLKLNEILTKPSSPLGYDVDLSNALDEVGVTREEFFNMCLISLERTSRTKEEIRMIYGYLFFMKDFTTMIKKQDEAHYFEYLQIIATHMNYEKLERNRVLMRFGDKGKKAYIILNGEIDILIKSPKKMKIFERDYLIYIATLIRYKEYGLVNLVVNDNFNTYPLEIEDDITKINKGSSTARNVEEAKSFFSLNVKNKSLKESKKTLSLKASYLLSLLNVSYVRMSSTASLNGAGRRSERDILNNVSTEEYIDRLNVIKDRSEIENTNKKGKYELIELTIYSYIKIISRSTGALFGEVALSDPLALRTATIITSTDCHFGTLNKQSYNLSLKAGADKQLRVSLHFICSFEIFSGISLGILNKRYFNNFSLKKVSKGSTILQQNTPSTNISLLREGSYEVYVNMSLNELTQLIKYFYSKLPNKKANIEKVEMSERECRAIMKDNIKFRKFYNSKELIRIREIQCPDIVGLSDFIDDNGENAFTVECKSPKGELFELSMNFYNEMLAKDVTVRTNEADFLNKKYDIVTARLLVIRNSKIQSFFDYKSKRDIFDFDIGTEITTAMMRTISQKRQLETKKTVIEAKDIKLVNEPVQFINTSIFSENLHKKKFKLNTSIANINNDTIVTNTSIIDTNRGSRNIKRPSRVNTASFTNKFINLKMNTTANHLKTLTKTIYKIKSPQSILSSSNHRSNSFSLNQSPPKKICMNDMIWENVNPKVKIPLLLSDMKYKSGGMSTEAKRLLKDRNALTDRNNVDMEKYKEIKRLNYNKRRNDYVHKNMIRINRILGKNMFLKK